MPDLTGEPAIWHRRIPRLLGYARRMGAAPVHYADLDAGRPKRRCLACNRIFTLSRYCRATRFDALPSRCSKRSDSCRLTLRDYPLTDVPTSRAVNAYTSITRTGAQGRVVHTNSVARHGPSPLTAEWGMTGAPCLNNRRPRHAPRCAQSEGQRAARAASMKATEGLVLGERKCGAGPATTATGDRPRSAHAVLNQSTRPAVGRHLHVQRLSPRSGARLPCVPPAAVRANPRRANQVRDMRYMASNRTHGHVDQTIAGRNSI